MSYFSIKIKQLRTEKSISQLQLAIILGVSQNAIYNWENGKREPSIDMIEQISAYFEISPSTLMGWDNVNVNVQKTISPFSAKTTDETRLLKDYRTLNSLGKKEAVKRVNELTCVPAYQQREIILNAAHEDNPTPEQKTAADDIMMNDAEWE